MIRGRWINWSLGERDSEGKMIREINLGWWNVDEWMLWGKMDKSIRWTYGEMLRIRLNKLKMKDRQISDINLLWNMN